MESEEIVELRGRMLGPSLSVSYEAPLHIVKGAGQYLYDADGVQYLDCVNNVCHVGHCHPKVVQAAQEQIAVLNTNTRYLHENIVRYAERLIDTLPEKLNTCFFVSSGSEANELALRMARTHTAKDGVIVVDGAYHGNTTTMVDLSPYKYNGPGGMGPPSFVQAVSMPDVFRGRYRDPLTAGRMYAEEITSAIDELEKCSHPPAAFFCESLLSCGGQVVLPDEYLANAYRIVRKAGGVCVADEVQVGFGRVGTHFWGFETQGVIPDIVTMGKPIGNGHPMAAVVTTTEIADSFNNGMEYFNTFGGNPVSCAVGLSVLDVIKEEKLQEHALEVGASLKRDLESLKERHGVIGDVRGLGLFLGVEFVKDRASREPDSEIASAVVERMKQERILLSTDGPFQNVIKIKPPLVFSESDRVRVVDALDRILAKMSA